MIRKFVFILICVISLTSCGNEKFTDLRLEAPCYDFYISLKDGNIIIGDKFRNKDLYTYDDKEDIYIQEIGLYDFSLDENEIITRFRSASKDVYISDKIHVGQSKKEIDSYLKDFIEFNQEGLVIYYKDQINIAVEVKYKKDIAEIIQVRGVKL